MQRRPFLARAAVLGAGCVAAALPCVAAAQAAGRRRLGVLLFDEAASWRFFVDDLRTELAALGWVEGRNLVTQWRFAGGDAARLAPLAAELVRSGVDAILTRGSPATRALQGASASVPIVTGVGDPIGSGFARSYARPGGNITGISYAAEETTAKQIELLREVLPRLVELLIVLTADRSRTSEEVRIDERVARANGLKSSVALVEAKGLPQAYRSLGPSGTLAAIVHSFGPLVPLRAVTGPALEARLPTMYREREYVEAGGLMSYSFQWENQTRTTAVQIDKVLRGEPPSAIPFELPTRSRFAVNRTTARDLGVALPQAVLARADEVFS